MPEIIVQAGYMSGDMFGVAAALRLETTLRVLVVNDLTDSGNATKMLQLYKTSVGPLGLARVVSLTVANSRTFYKSLHEPTDPNRTANRAVVFRQFPALRGVTVNIRALGRSTEIVSAKFRSGVNPSRDALIAQWQITDFDELGLQRYLNRRGLTHGHKYLFLWIRLSGKQGGAHTELDASRFGWQQIINALPTDIVPAIIGDKFNTPLTYPRGKLIDLTEFWNDIPFCLYKHVKFVGAEARRSQFALFDYMQRAGYKLCHLGMRSGVLESVALMGSRVFYMEERGNPQQARIENMAGSMPNFDRLELSQLPTRRGKLIDRNQKTEWGDLYGNHIGAIARHCNEPFKIIAQRISELEKNVAAGALFANYLAEFIRLAAPVWLPKYGNVSNWPAYKLRQATWANRLEVLLRSLYDDTFSKTGFAKGFTTTDLNRVVGQVTTALT